MAVSRASRWVPSGRTALGASALADGVVRAPEDVVAPLASIAGGLLASPAVGFLTTWTMFAVALYTFAHLAYGHLDVEDQTDVPREKPGFRVVFASTGVALGLAIQHLAEIWQLLAVVVPGMFAAGGVFLAYLSTLHGWDLTDPRGRGVATLERFAHGEDVATEIATDLEYPGWLGRLGLTLYLLSVALLFGIPVALAAVALQVLVYSFPIPDVLFFGWAVSARLLPQVSVGPTRERIVDLEFDFEEYLVDTTEHATRSFQGFFATTFVLLGLFLSAGYLFVGVSTAPAVAGTIAAAVGLLPAGLPPDVLLTVWNLSGALTLLFVAGSHGIWTWIRELGRLPAFLDSWEGRDTESEAEPVTRVYGFLGVAIVGWTATAAFVTLDAEPVRRGFAVAWPVIVASGLWSVRKTLRRDPQDVTGEHRWIYPGFVVQTLAFWAGVSLPSLAAALGGDGSLLSVLTVPVGLTVLLGIVAAIPTVSRYEHRHDDLRRHSMVGLILALGTLGAAGARVVPAEFELVTVTISVFCLASGSLLGIVRYFDL